MWPQQFGLIWFCSFMYSPYKWNLPPELQTPPLYMLACCYLNVALAVVIVWCTWVLWFSELSLQVKVCLLSQQDLGRDLPRAFVCHSTTASPMAVSRVSSWLCKLVWLCSKAFLGEQITQRLFKALIQMHSNLFFLKQTATVGKIILNSQRARMHTLIVAECSFKLLLRRESVFKVETRAGQLWENKFRKWKARCEMNHNICAQRTPSAS